MMRPHEVFDPKLQHERTSLAWERTAIAGMVLGVLTTRVGGSIHAGLGLVGIVQVLLAAALLVWSGRHYEELHGTLRSGESPTHPRLAKLVGVSASTSIGLATLLTALHIVAVP